MGVLNDPLYNKIVKLVVSTFFDFLVKRVGQFLFNNTERHYTNVFSLSFLVKKGKEVLYLCYLDFNTLDCVKSEKYLSFIKKGSCVLFGCREITKNTKGKRSDS